MRVATLRRYGSSGLIEVSTHATRAGRDRGFGVVLGPIIVSTHATRAGRDKIRRGQFRVRIVSTHATRAGRDTNALSASALVGGFNSRDPCGSRPKEKMTLGYKKRFNSRDPCGSRPTCTPHRPPPSCFNSRDPCGSRLQARHRVMTNKPVSTHATRAGRDCARSPILTAL